MPDKIIKSKRSKSKKQQMLAMQILSVAIVLVIIVVIIIVLVLAKNGGLPNSGTKETKPEQQTSVVQDVVGYKKPGDIYFSLNTKKAEVEFSNGSDSTQKLEYKIYLDGKVIYESGYIIPGQTIKEITLDLPADIEAGDYDIIIEQLSYDSAGGVSGTSNNKTLHITD
ncbi:MAG: hypothetical protein K6F92_02955 [Lachnospiraceae bacterium]|nr:hypothetical protein [Lachnospiraceae bacterium]